MLCACLFTTFRLGAILTGVQTKQGKQMLKSTLIATCLHQNSLIPDVPTGEAAVKRIFTEYYPGRDFKKWNTQLPDHIVERFLQASRNANTIRVDSFIRDLWNQ
ncbi:hypothetical protein LECLMA074M_21965 [Leclercia sp. M-A074-M]